ncbi:MAG: hypothetical protein ACOYNZ_17960, partial [Rhodoferax sp.]
MNRNIQLYFLSVLSLVFSALVGCGGQDQTPTPTPPVTPKVSARMLVQANALMGPGQSAFGWSPQGATLAYVDPVDGRDVLWAYDAATAAKRVLLDPGANPEQISVSSAQWSPQGNLLLLLGANALWLLDAKT